MENNLSTKEIEKFLNNNHSNLKIEVFDTINSTNDYAKQIAEKSMQNMLVVADSQTAGRGRFSRKFFSPAKTGIYMSIVLNRETRIEDSFLVTFAAAVATCKTIEELTGKKPKIKWINDIISDGKKVCGILTETALSLNKATVKYFVAGIGLNVTTENFPEEISEVASSIFCTSSRNEIIAKITNNFLDLTENLDRNAILTEYKKRSNTINQKISYIKNDIEKFATALDVNENGNLVICDENNEISTLDYGDIYLCNKTKFKVLPKEF